MTECLLTCMPALCGLHYRACLLRAFCFVLSFIFAVVTEQMWPMQFGSGMLPETGAFSDVLPGHNVLWNFTLVISTLCIIF